MDANGSFEMRMFVIFAISEYPLKLYYTNKPLVGELKLFSISILWLTMLVAGSLSIITTILDQRALMTSIIPNFSECDTWRALKWNIPTEKLNGHQQITEKTIEFVLVNQVNFSKSVDVFDGALTTSFVCFLCRNSFRAGAYWIMYRRELCFNFELGSNVSWFFIFYKGLDILYVLFFVLICTYTDNMRYGKVLNRTYREVICKLVHSLSV